MLVARQRRLVMPRLRTIQPDGNAMPGMVLYPMNVGAQQAVPVLVRLFVCSWVGRTSPRIPASEPKGFLEGFLSESRRVVIAKPRQTLRLWTGTPENVYQPRAEGFSRRFLHRNSSRLRSGRGLGAINGCGNECLLVTSHVQ
jgi:hypothetical protein